MLIKHNCEHCDNHVIWAIAVVNMKVPCMCHERADEHSQCCLDSDDFDEEISCPFYKDEDYQYELRQKHDG